MVNALQHIQRTGISATAACRYTATEVLAGDNAYDCGRCAAKTSARRRLAFEVAPNTLQLCLKRFLSVRARALVPLLLTFFWLPG